MAKQVIVLETTTQDGGLISLRVAFWLPITAGQEAPLSALSATPSAWKSAATDEIAALQAGTVVEEVRVFLFAQSVAVADIRKLIQTAYSDRVAYLAALPPKGKYYGSYFDGTAWAVLKG